MAINSVTVTVMAVPFVGKQFRNGGYEDAMQISLDTVREIKAQVTAGN